MPDLSDVLGDVYNGVYGGGSSAPPPASEPEAEDEIATNCDTKADDNDDAGAPSARVNDAPGWADESRLDAAFASWRPGPDRNAPAAERKLFGEAALAPVAPRDDDEPPRRPRPLDGDMAAALSEALAAPTAVTFDYTPPVAAEPVSLPVAVAAAEPLVEPAPPAVLVPAGPWHRGDDDLLPSRRGARFVLRRR